MNHGGGRAREPAAQPVRESGYYWIQPRGREPTIGHWASEPPYWRNWIVCGEDEWIEDSEVTVLSGRLTPPG